MEIPCGRSWCSIPEIGRGAVGVITIEARASCGWILGDEGNSDTATSQQRRRAHPFRTQNRKGRPPKRAYRFKGAPPAHAGRTRPPPVAPPPFDERDPVENFFRHWSRIGTKPVASLNLGPLSLLFFSISSLPLLFHTCSLPFLVLPYYHFHGTCYFLLGTFSL